MAFLIFESGYRDYLGYRFGDAFYSYSGDCGSGRYFLMNLEELIWRRIAEMYTPGFFITAEMHRTGSEMPEGLEAFVYQKLKLIKEGLGTRRFVFQEGEWRIYLTFFPTDKVVDERYALKNKVVSRGYR